MEHHRADHLGADDRGLLRRAVAISADDHVIRYAGDEFVVVAPSADPAQVLDRVERLRERLKFERSDGPPIRFAAGHAILEIDGDSEAALKAADEAMYREKEGNAARLRTV